MNQISEELQDYINYIIPDTLKHLYLKSLDIVAKFTARDIEEPYVGFALDDSIDVQAKDLLITKQLKGDLVTLIEGHKIKLDKDHEPSINTLYKICESILLLQNLDDYEEILSISMSLDDNKDKFVKIVSLLGSVEELELIYAIDDVEDIFFVMLNDLAVEEELNKVTSEEILGDRKLVIPFLAFTDEHESLGRSLWVQGYDKLLSVEDLYNIVPFDVKDHIEKTLKSKGPAYSAIDLLSFLMITHDGQKDPIDYLNNNSNIFFNDLNSVTMHVNIMRDMYSNFLNYLKTFEEKQSEEENVDGNNN